MRLRMPARGVEAECLLVRPPRLESVPEGERIGQREVDALPRCGLIACAHPEQHHAPTVPHWPPPRADTCDRERIERVQLTQRLIRQRAESEHLLPEARETALAETLELTVVDTPEEVHPAGSHKGATRTRRRVPWSTWCRRPLTGSHSATPQSAPHR